MPFARLIQGFVGIAAGDFGGVTNHDENANANTGGEMVDGQSMATLCLTPKCGTHVVRGETCQKCGAVCAANTGSL